MDYEPMWRVVDAHRRCADELERTLRELTGDQSVSEEPIGRDDIEWYNIVFAALQEARDQLLAMADREGHSIRRQDASRCRVFSSHCIKAVNELWKLGNR